MTPLRHRIRLTIYIVTLLQFTIGFGFSDEADENEHQKVVAEYWEEDGWSHFEDREDNQVPIAWKMFIFMSETHLDRKREETWRFYKKRLRYSKDNIAAAVDLLKSELSAPMKETVFTHLVFQTNDSEGFSLLVDYIQTDWPSSSSHIYSLLFSLAHSENYLNDDYRKPTIELLTNYVARLKAKEVKSEFPVGYCLLWSYLLFDFDCVDVLIERLKTLEEEDLELLVDGVIEYSVSEDEKYREIGSRARVLLKELEKNSLHSPPEPEPESAQQLGGST